MVDGHELHEEDLRLMYTFDQSSGSAAQYEAHSDAQVCSNFKPYNFGIRWLCMQIEHLSGQKRIKKK